MPFRRFPVQCSVTYNVEPFLNLPLAYFSGFWLLITLLMLSSGPAYGEWVSIGTVENGSTIYVVQDTIRRKGELVKLSVLADFANALTIEGIVNLSAISQEEHDCQDVRRRTVAITYFSGHMGSGKVNYSDSDEGKWIPVPLASPAQALLRIACVK
jgi:hypothetical protein